MAKPRRRRIEAVPHAEAMVRQKREEGFLTGHHYGYHLGRCEAIFRQTPVHPQRMWNVKVLYVTSGKGYPYSPLDEAIIDGLKAVVREVAIFQLNPKVKTELASVAIREKPDLVLMLEGLNLDLQSVYRLRQAGIPAAIWFTDDPYYTDMTDKLAPHFDYVFTLELNCLDLYRRLGCREVHYLPFAADVRKFRPVHLDLVQRKEICFIGSAYWNRVRSFDELASYLSEKKIYICGLWWDRLKHYPLLKRNIDLNRWLSPEETALAYNGSRIVINMHRAHDDATYNFNSRNIPAASPNPRMFEIASCGTLQVADIRDDMSRFYKPGEEILTYSSVGELIEISEYFLTHDSERQEIALRALRRTLEEHTYPKRLAQMMQIVFG
ncbi:MAG: spore maturation protein cgeB [Cohnella sp.]|uniref:CgeB family protein n=1 Tax=Cohnella sp. TaxID=1883426 RepID=UPI000E36FAD8|nr:glycosyltransferase [Cohnella sp.]REK63596.1 MAG: spore maturation protein cgeB [Cohnella sp.]